MSSASPPVRTTLARDLTQVVSEAIFDIPRLVEAARRWFQTPNRIPAEEMAARIETMVSPVLFGASVAEKWQH